ncbi:AAA family ATPase [Sorangium sp. So ce1128]
MPLASPYTIIKPLSLDGRAVVYRAVRSADRCPVILKVLDPRRSRPKDLERLKHEYELGQLLDSRAVVKPLALETYQGMPALILEDFGGQSLDRLLGTPMGVERFLPLAIRIAAAVTDVHQQDIIHKDLKPDNILVNPASGEVRITDFGVASRLPREQQRAQPPRLIEGSLPYLSPEQTGRTSRAIDNRTDLYSLGVTFYQMLTGRPPFEARDPVEWVHCHVARVPTSPSELVPEVPEMISRIILKLLSKMPEDRYQSARGLQRDLERCLAEWSASGRVEPFALGERDTTGRLQIPQKLYGREAEVALLLQAFGRVVATGTPELLLISGYSGIGKSALVHELHKPIIRDRAFFLSGKFDQYKRDIPYATLVQAFQELVIELLAESEERIAAWRQRLLGALGVNAQLIVEVIPQVELVIGRQPPVPELPPTEAQNRFRMVFRHFIGVFAQKEHPLALFLDDLQWVDAASLGLLKDLLAHPEMRYLLIIGAYRDNEVSPTHPLVLTLDEVRKGGARVSNIVLGPIPHERLAAFVGEALRCRLEDAAPLSDLVYEKTAGNPFFAIQFLLSLHEERLIEFDERTEAFRWDVAKIREKGYTDNVVDLMVGKLRRLPAKTQEALKQLACLGNTAEVALLAMVRGSVEHDVHADLWEAVRAGLVIRLDSTYKFLHDRIQEAAYSLIPAELRAEMHLQLGRLLLSRLPEQGLAERVFDVANQLNHGAHLLTDPREKEALCRLNFLAGTKAKASVAYASARSYLAHATSLLPPDAWSARYEDAFTLHLELAECEYLVGRFQRADELFDLILQNARSRPDRSRAHRLRLRFYQIAGRHRDAVTVMIQALQLYRVMLPESDEEIQMAAEAEIRQVSINLRGRPIADLVDAPVATDESVRALIGLLAESSPIVYTSRPALWLLLTAKGVNVSLQCGHAEESSFIYSYYSMVLVSIYHDIPRALQFSEMALRLNEKFKSATATLKGKLLFHHASVIKVWCGHFAASLPLMEQAFLACLDIGDLVFAGYLTYNMTWLVLESGEPLVHAIDVARKHIAFARQTHNDVVYHVLRVEEQFAASLKGATQAPTSFSDGTFDEESCIAALKKAGFGLGITYYHIMKQIATFTHERYAEALQSATSAASMLRQVASMAIEATHHFYHALTLTALYAQAPAEQQRQFAQTLEKQLQKLELWADNCPENFQTRYALVSAEVARIEGRDLDAMRLYEEAIRSARDSGLVHVEALAYELASRFYRARGFVRFADTYLREARSCYVRWGADGKVQSLDRCYPELVERPSVAPTATFVAAPEQLDLFSVVKALQSISSEILLPKLSETLLQIVLQQAGGQRGALILVRDGELAVYAEATTDGTEIRVASHEGVPASAAAFPMSILHYVARTREPVILDEAAVATRFASDEHLTRRRPHSLLCLPIVRQARVSGLVYLENNLATGAFTAGTIRVLELLGAQTAISLDNAMLYADLERSQMEIKAVLDNMVDSVFVVDRTGRVTLANHAAARLAGLASPDEARVPIVELARRLRFDRPNGTPYEAEQIPLVRALGGETVALDEGTISLPGAERTRYVHTSASPMRDAAGQVVGAVAVARDVTELVELDRLKDQFLRVAAHELKTPVTVIMGYAEMLLRTAMELPPRQRRILDGLLRGTERIERIVADLLFVSQIQIGRLNLVLERVDLGELVDRMAARLEQAAPSRRIRVTRPEAVVLQGDRELLERAVTHLLDNALRYSPDGRDVEVDVRIEDARDALVSVRDQGVGIPVDKRACIFERFHRAHTDTPHDHGGMGTGLYLSRAIVVRHGGEMWFESEEGRGSTFHVRLPLTCEGATVPS